MGINAPVLLLTIAGAFRGAGIQRSRSPISSSALGAFILVFEVLAGLGVAGLRGFLALGAGFNKAMG